MYHYYLTPENDFIICSLLVNTQTTTKGVFYVVQRKMSDTAYGKNV